MAEGFDVSTDVIRRVLKSKFVPTLKQKLRQDQKVLKKAELKKAGDTWKLPPTGCSMSGPVLIPGGETSAQGQGHSAALKMIESNTHSTSTPRRRQGRNKGIQSLEKERFVPVTAASGRQSELQKYSRSDCEGTRGTDSDGSPSENRLEEVKAGGPGDQNFSSKVVQRGREFFDDNGNFLYRI